MLQLKWVIDIISGKRLILWTTKYLFDHLIVPRVNDGTSQIVSESQHTLSHGGALWPKARNLYETVQVPCCQCTCTWKRSQGVCMDWRLHVWNVHNRHLPWAQLMYECPTCIWGQKCVESCLTMSPLTPFHPQICVLNSHHISHISIFFLLK